MRRKKPGPAGGPSTRLRVAEDIRMKLAQIVMRELDDPRLDGVHLTRVEVTPDLSHAVVAWRTLPGVPTDAAASAFKKAAGFLRRRLAASLRLRHVPELEFRFDELVDSGERIEGLLAGLAASRTTRPKPDGEALGGGRDDDGEE